MKISLITAFGIIFAASLTAALDKADEEGKIWLMRLNVNSKCISTFCKLFSFWIAIKNTNHIEGDMILSEEQYDNLFFQMRNGLTNEKYYWPNGIVPIAMNSNHTTEQQEYIERAIKKIESVSCIKFIPRTIEDNFIQLTVSMTIVLFTILSSKYLTLAICRRGVVVIRKLVINVVNKWWICNRPQLAPDAFWSVQSSMNFYMVSHLIQN